MSGNDRDQSDPGPVSAQVRAASEARQPAKDEPAT